MCAYPKMVESGRVPGKGRIRPSNEKLSGRYSEEGTICVSTQKWKNLGEYREMVDSGRVTEKDRIRASIENLSQRIPENG